MRIKSLLGSKRADKIIKNDIIKLKKKFYRVELVKNDDEFTVTLELQNITDTADVVSKVFYWEKDLAVIVNHENRKGAEKTVYIRGIA